MTREQLLDALPPCGLLCHTCPAFAHGAIQAHASALLKLSEGYREFLAARLPPGQHKVLEQQDIFEGGLKWRAEAECPGCRKGAGTGPGCISGCIIPACAAEHGVDFCGECARFPCGLPEASGVYHAEALAGFLEGGSFIRDHGAEAFFEARKDVSHYKKYKDNGAG